MSLNIIQNEFDEKNNLSLYQIELAKKDKQIISLQNKISSLLCNKNSLISQMDISKQKIIPSLKNMSPKNNHSNNKLLSSFQPLQLEDSIFRKNLNAKIGDKFNNTFQYKLLSAQKEIENLTIMNTIKDKIIMIIQNFINNLNIIICKGKINLNLNQVDVKTFNANVKKLEEKIMKKLQKIPKPNKIPESIIKKVKENSIRKQRTEVNLSKKKHLFLIPLKNKINTQTSINESKYSNTSFKKQHFTCQNYTKKKINELKSIKNTVGRNKSIKNKTFKENTLKLKRFLLAKKIEVPMKKHIRSLDSKYYNEYLKTINNEMSFSKILSENRNCLLNKKLNGNKV